MRPINNEQASNNRFWEFYFVRYFVGAVLGAGIIFFLNSNPVSPLLNKIIPGMTNISKLSGEGLILLGALGLAYCYIASAPVLVLHAVRGVFLSKKTNFYSWANGIALLLIVSVSAWSYNSFPTNNNAFLTYVLLALILALQLIPLFFALFNEGQVLHDYYNKLVISRSRKSPQAREYIESYRHLREHGNAFFILIFELALGATLWSSISSQFSLLVLLIWISPAALVWFLGTILEYRFANSP